MATGVVKWFSNSKGFGFIEPDDNTEEVFAHFSGITITTGYRSLEENDHVSYDVTAGQEGPQAENITVMR